MSTIRYTYADYLSIPETGTRRFEIVDGELFMTAAPRFRHQQVALNLAEILRGTARSHDLGEVVMGPITVHLHDQLVLEPDVIFIREARLGIIGEDGRMHGPPDLVVEVLSPSTQSYDRGLKRKRYLENGVRELWIVDADEGTVEIWGAADGRPTLTGEVLTWQVGDQRFEISREEVFRG